MISKALAFGRRFFFGGPGVKAVVGYTKQIFSNIFNKDKSMATSNSTAGETAPPCFYDAFARALVFRHMAQVPDSKLDINAAAGRLQVMFPELFDSQEAAISFLTQVPVDPSTLYRSQLSQAGVIRNEYLAAGRTRAAMGLALRSLVAQCSLVTKDYCAAYEFLGSRPVPFEKEEGLLKAAVPRPNTCKVCFCALNDQGYCSGHCSYRAWPQSVPANGILEFPPEEIEILFGVKNRFPPAQERRALAIRTVYQDGGPQSLDLNLTIKQLLTECPAFFSDEDEAEEFLTDYEV